MQEAATQEPATRLLSTTEVARRLGVKPQTVYAYVSRGLLHPHAASAHRKSLFAPDEVERLAARARRPSRSGALEVVIETRLTALDPDGRLHSAAATLSSSRASGASRRSLDCCGTAIPSRRGCWTATTAG